MHFLYAISLAITLGIAATSVEGYSHSQKAGISRLSARAITDQHSERSIYNIYQRDLDTLYERESDTLHSRFFTFPNGKTFDVRSNEPATLFRRASSRCSSSPSPTRGYLSVDMDDARLAPRGHGIETTGICGCTAVGVVGAKGSVVAHVGPGDQASIRKLSALVMQIGGPAQAVVYAPTENGRMMDPGEVSNIQRALGHVVPKVTPYEFRAGAHQKILTISTSGSISWR